MFTASSVPVIIILYFSAPTFFVLVTNLLPALDFFYIAFVLMFLFVHFLSGEPIDCVSEKENNFYYSAFDLGS